MTADREKEAPSLGKYLKEKLPTLLYMLGGNVTLALALILFMEKNGIAAGGFTGIAIIINYVYPVRVDLFTLVLTLPFLVWGWFTRGREFTVLTFISQVMFTGVYAALRFLPTLTEDLLLASVCGGLLFGVSAVLFLRGNSSSGGTDLMVRIFAHYRRDVSLGTLILITDGLVVLASMIVAGNVEIGIYAVISLAVCSLATDRLILSANKASLFFIITENDPAPISNAILFELGRGATLLDGAGMYARHIGAEDHRSVLMVVVKPRQAFRVKSIVRKTDPRAFVVLCPADGILGEGFPTLEAGGDNW